MNEENIFLYYFEKVRSNLKYQIALIILLALILIPIVFIYIYTDSLDTKELNSFHQYFAQSIKEDWDEYMEGVPENERNIVEYKKLMDELGFLEGHFARRVFEIDPINLGFKGQKHVTQNLGVLIEMPPVTVNGLNLGTRYVPEHAYNDYNNMVTEIRENIGRMLYIQKGYISPGKQAYEFITSLVENDYSIETAIGKVSMPGYTEHNSPLRVGLDFINGDGISGHEPGQKASDFEKLAEYKWLQVNGTRHNFHISYPKNNQFGVPFQPWQWHWEPGKKLPW